MKQLRDALALAATQLNAEEKLENMSNAVLAQQLVVASDLLRDDLSPEDLKSLWQEAVYDASRIVQKLQQWINLANAFTPILADHEFVQEAVTTFSDMKETVWFGMEAIYPSAIMRERPEAEPPEAPPEAAPEALAPVPVSPAPVTPPAK